MVNIECEDKIGKSNAKPSLCRIHTLMSPTNSVNSSGGCFEPSYGASNSSWRTTMHPIVVGTHKLYPLSIEMEQRLILHYLIPTCEYQDVNFF